MKNYKTPEDIRIKSKEYYWQHRDERLNYQNAYSKGERRPKQHMPEKIMDGYVWLYLPDHLKASKTGHVKRAVVVLENKLGRPIRKGYVCHHRDRNKMNDSPDNLFERGASAHGREHGKDGGWNSNGSEAKPVEQYTLDGRLVSTYRSIKEASRAVGCNVLACVHGRSKTSGGFIWKLVSPKN